MMVADNPVSTGGTDPIESNYCIESTSDPVTPAGPVVEAEVIAEGRRLLEAVGDDGWRWDAKASEVATTSADDPSEEVAVFYDQYVRPADAEAIVWLRNHADALLAAAEDRSRLEAALREARGAQQYAVERQQEMRVALKRREWGVANGNAQATEQRLSASIDRIDAALHPGEPR